MSRYTGDIDDCYRELEQCSALLQRILEEIVQHAGKVETKMESIKTILAEIKDAVRSNHSS
jgi:hypothetical protein